MPEITFDPPIELPQGGKAYIVLADPIFVLVVRRVYPRAMPSSKAAATTDLANAALNPLANQSVAGGHTAHLSITFNTGRNPDLDGLLTAIETFYGAGKVSSDLDTNARSVLRLRVIA
jgi:hypothetical protein